MRRAAKLLSLLVLASFATMALADRPTASSMLKNAEATAKAGKKNVLVLFHASW